MNKNIVSAGLYKDALKRIKVAAIIMITLVALIQFIIPLLVDISSMQYINSDVSGAS